MADVIPMTGAESGNVTTPGKPMTPEVRSRKRDKPITGVSVKLHDDNEWLLMRAGLWSNETVRWLQNEAFDYYTANGGCYLIHHMKVAAVILLVANYDLTTPEAESLIFQSDEKSVCEAGFQALMIFQEPNRRYSDWVRSALLANGLNPALIRADDLADILAQLVKTGRAMNPLDFTEVAQQVPERNSLLETMFSVDNSRARESEKAVEKSANPFSID